MPVTPRRPSRLALVGVLAAALGFFAFSWYGIPHDFWLLNPVMSHIRHQAVWLGLLLVAGSLVVAERPRAVVIVLSVIVGLAGAVAEAGAYAREHDLRLHYQLNRMAFTEIAGMVDGNRLSYGSWGMATLPRSVAYLSVDGTVHRLQGGAVLVPLFYAHPMRSGGFLYSQASPEGVYMLGETCRKPRDLGDGWWTCGTSI